MAALETPQAQIGWKARNFNLKGVDDKLYTLDSARGEKGLLVMFICNHCPFVKAILDKIIRDTADLEKIGINSIAIMSNDVANYPDDSFDNMKKLAEAKNFPFPYAIDETQSVAKDYGAVCTPDFFGFNANLELQYRGRLDESRMNNVDGASRELFEAMKEIAQNGTFSGKQNPSIGCSIKWAA